MTKPFWTPEKKEEYLKLRERREEDRKYHRQYMNDARKSGRYNYYRDGEKVIYEKDENRARQSIYKKN